MIDIKTLIDTGFHRKNKYDYSKSQFYINYVSNGIYETILSGSHIPSDLEGQHVEILKEALRQGTITGCWQYEGVQFGNCPISIPVPKQPGKIDDVTVTVTEPIKDLKEVLKSNIIFPFILVAGVLYLIYIVIFRRH